MFLALAVFNVVHPGRIMSGKESDFPSRKERKNYFKAGSPGNSLDLLPKTEPVGSASMPGHVGFQPEMQNAVPNTGYVR